MLCSSYKVFMLSRENAILQGGREQTVLQLMSNLIFLVSYFDCFRN